MFSDAVDREAAWLSTSGDSLPNLGSLFQVLQARWPRVPSTSKTALYVLRAPSASFRIERYAAIRSMSTTELLLKLRWPLSNGQGSAEAEQLNFEQAIDQVLLRVSGFISDKTHGGRFLSVAEGHSGVTVNYDDPEESLVSRIFKATVAYSADDPELNN